MADTYFTEHTLAFLRKLADNNDRDWFNANKLLYEDSVRTPALRFITDMADELPALSPHFLAQPRKVGGSLMRVYRDVRFGNDKRPFKTNIGIQFRHEQGKDVHAPGFYVHIEPDDCFLGVGIWRPDSRTLGKIRDHLCEQDERWQAAIDHKGFRKHFQLSGESLQRAPRGYNSDHPLIEDLKRKDFIAIAPIEDRQVLQKKFRGTVMDHFHAANDFMQYLCEALQLRY